MKWFDDFFYHKLKSKSVIAIGLFDENYGQCEFLLLENVKGEIKKADHYQNQSLDNILELCKEHPKTPVVVCLDNSSLLVSEPDEHEFNEDDFVQVHNEDYGVSGILRRQASTDILERFSELENGVVGFHLGAVGVLDYIEFSESSSEYTLGNNSYRFDDEHIVASLATSYTQRWEGEDYNSHELLLYLVGSNYFVSNLDDLISVAKPSAIDHSYELLYKKVLLFGSVVCIMLFILSAGIFMAYDQEVKFLEAEFKSNIELRNKYQFYAKSITDLEDKLNVSTREIRYARICTEIADRLPREITLNQLVIDPMVLNSGSRKGKFQELNTLKIKGKSSSLRLVSAWVSDLKHLAWVEDISKQEILNEQNKIVFTIELTIRDVR